MLQTMQTRINKFYFDVADTPFKVKHRNHTRSFKYPKYENSTKSAKYMWQVKQHVKKVEKKLAINIMHSESDWAFY